MISITKSQIPDYLHNSEYYLSLEDDDVSFEIPKKILKKTDIVDNFHDFKSLLKTIQFFGIDITESIILYYLENSLEVVSKFLIDKTEEKYQENVDSIELAELFKNLIKIEIKNFDQFIANSIILKNYDLNVPKKYVEYGLKNRIKFLYNYKEYFISWNNPEEDFNEFTLNNYIYLLYKELNDHLDYSFKIKYRIRSEILYHTIIIYISNNFHYTFGIETKINSDLNLNYNKNHKVSLGNEFTTMVFQDKLIIIKDKNTVFNIQKTNFNKYIIEDFFEKLNDSLKITEFI
uniref:Uncharacterized protein n=1 Tax=viral metagenome TaxID=1070528 RepID=A0A6C0ADC5_9ZZZZ